MRSVLVPEARAQPPPHGLAVALAGRGVRERPLEVAHLGEESTLLYGAQFLSPRPVTNWFPSSDE